MKKSNLTSLLLMNAIWIGANSQAATGIACTDAGAAASEARALGEFQYIVDYDGSKGMSEDVLTAQEDTSMRINLNGGTCTGTLLTGDIVITAAHCFEKTVNNQKVIDDNLAGDTVIFNFELDELGNPQAQQEFPITEILEWRPQTLDYAVLQIGANSAGVRPTQLFPVGRLSDRIPTIGENLLAIGHAGGLAKQVESGAMITHKQPSTASWVEAFELFTQGGGSGGAVTDNDGFIVSLSLAIGCTDNTFRSGGHSIKRIAEVSPTLQYILNNQKKEQTLGYLNTFDDELEWANVGEFNWQLISGSTPSSGTGPSSGKYAYFETSATDAKSSGDRAILVSHPFDGNGKAVSFSYHMYGSNIGTLSLEYLNNGVWSQLWTKSGQQQTSQTAAWITATVNIPAIAQPTRVRLKATAAGGFRGDIAIDNLQVHPQWKKTSELLSGFAYIRSASSNNGGADLNNQYGPLQASLTEHYWHSAQWSFELIDNQYYKITNRWNPSKSIHLQDNPPPAVDFGFAEDYWWSAHWQLVPVAGKPDTYRLKNRWRAGYYLYLNGSNFGSSNVNTTSDKFEWKFAKAY